MDVHITRSSSYFIRIYKKIFIDGDRYQLQDTQGDYCIKTQSLEDLNFRPSKVNSIKCINIFSMNTINIYIQINIYNEKIRRRKKSLGTTESQ